MSVTNTGVMTMMATTCAIVFAFNELFIRFLIWHNVYFYTIEYNLKYTSNKICYEFVTPKAVTEFDDFIKLIFKDDLKINLYLND